MGHPTLHKQHLSLHSLVSMSTMMSPTHNRIVPVVAAGGGSARSEIIPAHPTSSYFSISHAIQARFRLIFDALRDDTVADTLSKEGLRSFLHEVQRQDIELHEEKASYSFEEWMGFMWMYGGFDPIRELDERNKDLGRPITSYFVSSSHNTYLSGNQLSSKSSTEAYKNVSLRFLDSWYEGRFGIGISWSLLTAVGFNQGMQMH
jgi:phosphatidylinositol phospholipase C delta